MSRSFFKQQVVLKSDNSVHNLTSR